MKELEKLEKILEMEKDNAMKRNHKLNEMELKDQAKLEAAKFRLKQKEIVVREKNKQREERAKRKEEELKIEEILKQGEKLRVRFTINNNQIMVIGRTRV